MTIECIRFRMYDPEEIGFEEYAQIYTRICGLLDAAPDAERALSDAIEACNMFIDWAEATKRVLTPLCLEVNS